MNLSINCIFEKIFALQKKSKINLKLLICYTFLRLVILILEVEILLFYRFKLKKNFFLFFYVDLIQTK